MTLFKIPQEPNVRQKWHDFLISQGTAENKIVIDVLICEKHFEPDDIISQKNRKILRENSVPCEIVLADNSFD